MSRVHLKPVADQVVVIIGASSGIGRATAIAFAREGAQLVIGARKGEALEDLAIELRNHGTRCVTVPMDTSHFEEVRMVAHRAIDEFGRIDTWVQNAGIGAFARFIDMKPEEFRRIIEVNLLGSAYGAMVALEYLKISGGALIEVSSIESEVATPLQSAYAASKHGMKGFLDVLRMEVEHDRLPVSVTNIKPSAITTPFYTNALNKMGVKPDMVRPIYSPEKVADAIVHAAHVPQDDVIVGGAGAVMIAMKRLMPGLFDRFASAAGFRLQMTNERQTMMQSNLFEPAPDIRIRGDWKPTLG